MFLFFFFFFCPQFSPASLLNITLTWVLLLDLARRHYLLFFIIPTGTGTTQPPGAPVRDSELRRWDRRLCTPLVQLLYQVSWGLVQSELEYLSGWTPACLSNLFQVIHLHRENSFPYVIRIPHVPTCPRHLLPCPCAPLRRVCCIFSVRCP